MDKDEILLLIGAGIAIITSVITALVQHALSLRADKIKRLRDKTEQEQVRLKQIRRMLLDKDFQSPMVSFPGGMHTADVSSDLPAVLGEAGQEEPEQPSREKLDQQDEADGNHVQVYDAGTALADNTEHE